MKSKGICKGWIALLAALAMTLALCCGALAEDGAKLADSLLNDVEISREVSYLEVLQNQYAITIPNHDGVNHYVLTICREGNEEEAQWTQTLAESSEAREVVMNPFDGAYEWLPTEGGSFTLRIYAYPDETDNDELAAFRQEQVLVYEHLWDVWYPSILTTEEFADGLVIQHIPYNAQIDHYGFWLARIGAEDTESVYQTIEVSETEEFASLTINPNDESNSLAVKPGLYYLHMHAYPAEDSSDEDAEVVYAVVQIMEKVPEDGVHLAISPSESVTTDETIVLMSYAPGSDYQIIHITDENGDEFFQWEGGGEAPAFELHSGFRANSLHISAKAFYYQKNEDGDWIFDENGKAIDASEPVEVTMDYSVTAEGDVEIIAPELPPYIQYGEDLSFTVQKPAKAEYSEINVWWDDENGGLYYNDEWKEDTIEINISEKEIPDFETWVHVRIYGNAHGMNEADAQWDIPVLPNSSNEVTLVLTGLEEGNTIPANKNVQLEVKANNGERIQTISVFNGDGYWGHEGLDQDGTYIRDISFGDNRTYAVYAMVTFDEWKDEYAEEDQRNWIYTNIVTVTATAEGQVGSLTIAYTDQEDEHKTVTRGEIVQVQLTESENATNYYVNANCNVDWENGEEGWGYDFRWDWLDEENHIARIYTAGMIPGEYYISGGANAEGMFGYDSEWDNQVVYLTVEDPDTSEDPYFSFTMDGADKDNQVSVLTGGEIGFSAYAPYAGWIDIFYNGEEDGGWTDNFGEDFISFETRTPYWSTGEYTLFARAYYPQYDDDNNPIWATDEDGNIQTDDEGNPIQQVDWIDSASYTVQVSTTGEVVSIPMADLPLYLAPGSGLEVNVTAPDGTAWMHVNVNVFEEDNSWWPDSIRFWDVYGDNRTVSESISWDEFEEMDIHAGQTVVVNVNGGMPGCELQGWEVRIPVVDWTSEETPGAYLTFVDSEDRDAFEALVNQEIRLKVSASETANGRNIQVVRVFNGDHFEGEQRPDENGEFNLSVFRGEEKQYALYALVTYDEWQEEWDGRDDDPRAWLPTNVITLTLTSNGAAGAFEIQGVPEEAIQRGEFFEVTLTESEGADNYWLSSDGDYELNWSWADQEKRVARISTVFLGEGEFYFHAGANAVGMVNYDTDAVHFTVVEPENEGIIFHVEPDGDVYLDDTSYVSVYAKNAIHVGFVLDGDPWHLDENGNYQWGECGDSWYHNDGIRWDEGMGMGEHTLQACALYEEDGEWVYSDEITVNVQSKGQLDGPTLNVKGAYSATEDITFTIDGLDQENATWWWVAVGDHTDVDENGNHRELGHWDSGSEQSVPKTFTVDKNELFDGHRLIINAGVGADGYISGYSECQVVVVGMSDGTITLTIDNEAEADLNAWPSSKNMRVLVSAPGSTAIRVWNNGSWDCRDSNNMDENGVYTVDVNYGDLGTYTIVAMASYTSQTWDENFDWNSFVWDRDMEWTVTSNQIDVTITAKGQLDVPKYEVKQTTVKRGGAFEITIKGDQGKSEWYGARLMIPYVEGEHDYWESDYYPWDEDTKTIFVPTEYMEAGDYYQIMVWTDAEGWLGQSDFVDVVIEDVAEGEIFIAVDKTTVVTQEMIGWTVNAPGAKQIVVDSYTKDDGGNIDNYFLQNFDTAEWDDPSFARSEDNFGGHAGKAYISAKVTYEDGTTVNSDEIEITVIAPYGDLNTARIRNYQWYWNGGDMTFTFFPDDRTEWYGIEVWERDAEEPLYRTWDRDEPEFSREWAYSLSSDKDIRVYVYQAAYGYNDFGTDIWINKFDDSKFLYLPPMVTAIEEEAFVGVDARCAEIQEKVTTIGDRAFKDSNLSAVFVPASVESIGDDAFNEGVTIYGYFDTEAERYANDHGEVSFVGVE